LHPSRFQPRHFRLFSAALAFAAPLALYCASAYRDVTYWDVGEMDTVPYILGIAHPPGLPLYTLLGWAFTHAVPIGGAAFRMSLLSALAMSVAALFAYAIVVDLSDDAVAALAAAWIFACGDIAWTLGTRADVHACETALFCALAWMVLRWYRDVRDIQLYGVAALFGLAVAMHPVGLFTLSAILVAIVARLPACSPRTLGRAAALAVACALVWFVYLPLRSASVTADGLDPLVAIGLHGSAFWDYDHPVIAANFLALVSGSDVGLHDAARGDAVLLTFSSWTYLGAAFAFLGAGILARRDIARALILGGLCVPSAIFAYGFREESDLGRYFMPTILVGCVCAGVALAWLRTTRMSIPAMLAMLAVIAWLVLTQRAFFAQPSDDRARRDITETFAHTPDDAVIVAGWTEAPALAYASYVEHASGHRLIVPSWYGEVADQLGGWMRQRPTYVAGEAQGSVPGFRLERLPTHTLLYHVVRE
jgi:Protein of unknown function (DUF2723)